MAQDVVIKKDKLTKLVKALKKKIPVAQVGIFGDPRNATIGAFHEFGTSKIPERSFLREPLIEDLPREVGKEGSFTAPLLSKVMSEGTLGPWVDQLGQLGLKAVKNNFAMAGQGNWAPKQDGGKLLYETGQLQNAVTYRVVE